MKHGVEWQVSLQDRWVEFLSGKQPFARKGREEEARIGFEFNGLGQYRVLRDDVVLILTDDLTLALDVLCRIAPRVYSNAEESLIRQMCSK